MRVQSLGQTLYLSVDQIDAFCLWTARQSGHSHDITCHQNQHLGTTVDDDVSHIDTEPSGHAVGFGVGRE